MSPFEVIILRIFLTLSGSIALLMFCWRLKRRKLFWLWVIAFLALYEGIDYLSVLIIYKMESSALLNQPLKICLHSLFNITTFFALSGFMCVLFKEKYITLLFCCISGKLTMHVAEYLTKIIFHFTIMNTYLSMVIYVFVYVVIYFLFARRIRSEECEHLNNIKLIGFALIVLFATDVIIVGFSDSRLDESVNIYLFALIMIVCIAVLYLQYNLLAESRHKLESLVISSLREKERQQFEISKETINLIGIRQHDLKNMLESRNVGIPASELNEIVKSLDSSGLAYKTGNRTLDIILMEKYLVCKNKNIRFECFADGKDMGFISEMDVYSLFLNALNNAVEATEKIEDEDKREIRLKIYTRGSILFIQIRNYYNEVLRTSKGFQTTKPDKYNHGFGIKSMKMLAEKYGGEMHIETEDNVFSLGFAIPIP